MFEHKAAKLNGGVWGRSDASFEQRFPDVLDYSVMVTTGLSIQGLSPNHSSWVAIAKKGPEVEQGFQYGPPFLVCLVGMRNYKQKGRRGN